MLKLAVLGAGGHSRTNHLPALKLYAEKHPGAIELAALCDLRRDTAEAQAELFGFGRVYTDLDEMLSREQPDGCVAVTPIPATARIAAQIIRAGVPLLMEKPPGATVAEARELAALAAAAGARVMVSLNRRFDPALRRGLEWQGARALEFLRGTIVRCGRTEPGFMKETAIHTFDAMRGIAGDIVDYTLEIRPVGGARWYFVSLKFAGGATGRLEVMPTSGHTGEQQEIFGADFRILVRMGEIDSGEVLGWEQEHLVLQEEPARGQPAFVRNGAYGETVAFIAALQGQRALAPTPQDVLQSVEICHAIAAAG